MEKLPLAFYQGFDVLAISKDLLGKLLITRFDGRLTTGRIVETEAYNGVIDRASHSFGGRRTQRTEIMYSPGGVAYVYLCYGIHNLFNVITNVGDIPHAVLVRGIEPVSGVDVMMERMKKTVFDTTIGRGPGNVSKALGISRLHNGYSLLGEELFIADDGSAFQSSQIVSSPRIGVDYAGEDAKLHYRFSVKDNPFVSKSKS